MPSALGIGTASRGELLLLRSHWRLNHPDVHLPTRQYYVAVISSSQYVPGNVDNVL